MNKLLRKLGNIHESGFLNRALFYLVVLLILFIPLYPKLPSIGVAHTWVYIRAEDFLIAITFALFLMQLIRRKVDFMAQLSIPILLYFLVGVISLILSLIFIAPTLANFFPQVAVLSYLRRIEYMSLFFIGFAVIKQEKDVRRLFWVLVAASTVVLLYGIGQRYYINLWSAFPSFFEKYPFCFPSFQTTNEEFAKGIPLCLPRDGRITSLFGGHYDFSAYLVLVIPIVLSVLFAVRKPIQKAILALVGLGLVYVLILTSSRISFLGYIVGIIVAFVMIKRKMFLIPVLLISLFLLLTSSSSVLQRFTQTFRLTNILVNNQGQVVGEVDNNLSQELKNKIGHEPVLFNAPPPTQELPKGSSYLTLPGKKVATSSAFLKRAATLTSAQKKKYQFGAVELSSITGNFLVKKAFVYDISFTTRFQGEWPVSWKAFSRDPLFGSGYATVTLASDNSFLRALGEVGLLGFCAFFSFFLVWYIYIKKRAAEIPPFERYFVLGLSAGVVGLSINALLIDVFEASKVAESMWLLLGIGAGAVALSGKVHIPYLSEIKNVLVSNLFLLIYLLILFFVYIGSSFDNFFVGDDFSWLRWAAESNKDTLIRNFYDAGGFFLRPIDKLIIFGQYTLFSLEPLPYRIFNLFFNFGVSVAVYFLLLVLLKKKKLAFLGALLFSFIPSHSQNLFWIATISTTLSSLFILFGLLTHYFARTKNSVLLFVLTCLLFLCAVFTYENAVIFIGLVFLLDIFFVEKKHRVKFMTMYQPYIVYAGIILFYLGIRSQAGAAGFSGDYNYNLIKILPNAVGNFMGYIFLFFMGESALSTYNMVRTGLRTYAMLLSVLGFLILAFIGGFFIEHREKIYLRHGQKVFIFGFLFAGIALLPYLPLGNITLRYVYLGSFGFIVMALVVFDGILSMIKNKTANMIIFSLVLLGVGAWCYIGLQTAEKDWERASKITYDTIISFRFNHEIKKNTNLYFYNVPIKTGEAYIYPVGLPDALYFINNDKSVRTFLVKDRAQAEQLSKSTEPNVLHTWIFTFGKNFYLQKVDNVNKDEE